MTSTPDPDTTRAQVAQTYSRLIESHSGSCCAPAPAAASSCCAPATADDPSVPTAGCCGPAPAVEPEGMAAKVAGYDDAELGDLPADAVASSFGCGNPLAFSAVEPGQTVLDLGAGAGIDVLLAAERVGPTGRVIGVDMTDAMIARARANIEAAGVTHAEIRKGIIEALPVEDASVDWVISNCVINLSPEKAKVFAEIARVLKPGGRISISDIVVQDLPAWARQSQVLYGACVAGAISEAAYLAGLRDAGLVEVEVTERLVYEASQVRSFLSSAEVIKEAGALTAEQVDAIVATMTGKVWSAKVTGRRAAARS